MSFAFFVRLYLLPLKVQMESKKITFKNRVASFGFAFAGIARLVWQEPNAKLHALATVVAVSAGIWRGLSKQEWALIAVAICLVWMAEAFNTAIEVLCDMMVGTEYHPKVKIIKDVAAAGVLFAAMTALIIAVCVFV